MNTDNHPDRVRRLKRVLALLEFPPVRKKGWTREEIITELRRVAKKLGRTPKEKEFNKHASVSGKTAGRMFGTWNQGLAAVGLALNNDMNISKERVVAELKRVAKKLRHTPTTVEFNKHASMNKTTVVKRFVTWNQGLHAAGLKLNRR
jgi:preprotein translocase subunit Sss1